MIQTGIWEGHAMKIRTVDTTVTATPIPDIKLLIRDHAIWMTGDLKVIPAEEMKAVIGMINMRTAATVVIDFKAS